MRALPSELGTVIHEYKVDSSLERKIGWAIALAGFALFGVCQLADWGTFPRFCATLLSVLGTGMALSAYVKRNNRLVVHDLGLVQYYAWRSDAYRWTDIVKIQGFKREHYSSGIAYASDYSARLQLKNGSKGWIAAVALSREMIDYFEQMVAWANSPATLTNTGPARLP